MREFVRPVHEHIKDLFILDIETLSMTESFLYRVFAEKKSHSLKLVGCQGIKAEGKLRE